MPMPGTRGSRLAAIRRTISDRICGRGLPVDARDKIAPYAEVALRIRHAGKDGGLQLPVGEVRIVQVAGRVPVNLRIADGVGGGVLQIFAGDLPEVRRPLQDMRLKLAEDCEHAHGLLAPDIELLDLLFGRARAVARRHRLHRRLPHGAEQVAMELHLRDSLQKRLQIAHCPAPASGCVSRPRKGGYRTFPFAGNAAGRSGRRPGPGLLLVRVAASC